MGPQLGEDGSSCARRVCKKSAAEERKKIGGAKLTAGQMSAVDVPGVIDEALSSRGSSDGSGDSEGGGDA